MKFVAQQNLFELHPSIFEDSVNLTIREYSRNSAGKLNISRSKIDICVKSEVARNVQI